MGFSRLRRGCPGWKGPCCCVRVGAGEPAVGAQAVLVPFQVGWVRPASLTFQMLPLPKALSVLQVLQLPARKEEAPSTTGTRQCMTASCPCGAGTSAARCSRVGWAQVRRRGAGLRAHPYPRPPLPSAGPAGQARLAALGTRAEATTGLGRGGGTWRGHSGRGKARGEAGLE